MSDPQTPPAPSPVEPDAVALLREVAALDKPRWMNGLGIPWNRGSAPKVCTSCGVRETRPDLYPEDPPYEHHADCLWARIDAFLAAPLPSPSPAPALFCARCLAPLPKPLVEPCACGCEWVTNKETRPPSPAPVVSPEPGALRCPECVGRLEDIGRVYDPSLADAKDEDGGPLPDNEKWMPCPTCAKRHAHDLIGPPAPVPPHTATAEAFRVRIYLSGPQAVIEQECRAECLREGLCVTVEPTRFIYTGGEETGCVVGLLSYPRFPTTKDSLRKRAEALALRLLAATHQHSVLVVSDEEAAWFSVREEPLARASAPAANEPGGA